MNAMKSAMTVRGMSGVQALRIGDPTCWIGAWSMEPEYYREEAQEAEAGGVGLANS
jgi:hypothetical protein